MIPTTEQSLPAYPANADADVGPGQCEPVLVGAVPPWHAQLPARFMHGQVAS
jgi:hypothetical protein